MIGWRILCGALVFVAVTTTAAAGAGVLAGRLTLAGVLTSFVLGLAAAGLTVRGASAPRQKITVVDWVLFTVFSLASLRAFLWVIYDHGDVIKVLSPHNLGDMALHLNLINRWAAGGTFWPENPFLAGTPFAYHPGMDLWNAVLRMVGVPLYEGLRWTGLLGAAATAVALWRWGRGFALAAFLFAGGLAASALWQGGALDPNETDTAWKNIFLAVFVTQRGFLYAFPAGLVLLTVWRAQLRGEEHGPRLPVLAQVALYASMPLFNAPAFLFLSASLAACALAAWRPRLSRPFIVTGLVSIIPATWLVHLVTAGFGAPSAFRYAPGWMQADGGVWFWWWNFGLFLPLVVWLGLIVFSRGGGDRTTRVFYAVGAGTLVFCFVFAIAPWEWDNTKLIVWGYLTLMPLLWTQVLAQWPGWLRAATCVALFFSGALSLAVGLDQRHGYQLASRAEMADVQMLLRGVPRNARLATAPSYEHPALLLGRPLAMGYEGHLVSQGFDYAPQRTDLDCLMNGADGWRDSARRLGTRYLFWGRREAARWPQSTRAWTECAPLLGNFPAGQLYLLTPCLLEE